MHAKTQDALTYVREHGKPSLFITMTCSPKWIEIENQLFDGQRSNHREDIVARVCMTSAIQAYFFQKFICRFSI